MLFDYCLFSGGVLYLLMGRHILFLSTHRRQEKNQREEEEKKQHALFATIVFLQLSRRSKGETVLEWEGMDREGSNRKYSI